MRENFSKIGFIGGGKMASAILGGIVKSGFINPENIYVFDVNPQAQAQLQKDFNINLAENIEVLAKQVDTILIATKPFVIKEVLIELKNKCDNKLIISILAGVKIATIASELPNSRIIRVMPNTPALLKEGMCAICKGNSAQDEDLNFTNELLKNIGKTTIVDEAVIDTVTAVSGSGPAFYYYIINQIAKAGEKLGLDYDTALLLSAQTALGAAKMIMETNLTPQELITAVTTPGGCTAEGNKVLENSNIDEILDKTIEETMLKAKALG